jgi:hypothetical protein
LNMRKKIKCFFKIISEFVVVKPTNYVVFSIERKLERFSL